jgi:hypothetical protein
MNLFYDNIVICQEERYCTLPLPPSIDGYNLQGPRHREYFDHRECFFEDTQLQHSGWLPLYLTVKLKDTPNLN